MMDRDVLNLQVGLDGANDHHHRDDYDRGGRERRRRHRHLTDGSYDFGTSTIISHSNQLHYQPLQNDYDLEQSLNHDTDRHFWMMEQRRQQQQQQPIDDLCNLVIAHQESLIPSAISYVAGADDVDATDRKKNQQKNCYQQPFKKGRRQQSDGKGKEEDEPDVSDLTKALNQLSVSEREKATFDVHGVALPLTQEKEDPATIKSALDALDELIIEQATQHPGLAKALQINPSYIREERMKFLRSEEYDPVKAAERMGGYFDLRLEVFCRGGGGGDGFGASNSDFSCMARNLTVLDLTEEDIQYWNTGFYQICREKDRSGRIVCIIFLPICYQLKMPAANMVRINFVVNTILTQNIDVQLSGNVHIAWAIGLGADSMDYIGKDSDAKKIVEAGRYAPLRGVAKHFCYDHESLHPMFEKYAKPMSTFNAVRFRSHFGSPSEVSFNLSTFGISVDSLPISSDGTIQTDFHRSFVESLLQQQRERNNHLRGIVDKQRKERNAQKEQRPQIDVDGMIPIDKTFGPVESEGKRCDNRFGSLRYNDPDGNRETKFAYESFLEGPVTGIDGFVVPETNRFFPQQDGLHNERLTQGTERWDLASGHLPSTSIPDSKVNIHRMDRKLIRRTPTDSSTRPTDEVSPNDRIANFMAHIHPAVVVTNDSLSRYSSETSYSSGNNNDDDDDANNDKLFATRPMDVIFGRGGHNKSNPGNLRLKQLLEEHKNEYDEANRMRKTEIVSSIIDQMKKSGSRFVVEAYDNNHDGGNGGGGYIPTWLIASSDKVKNKVTHDFRNLRRPKKSDKAKR